MRVNSFFVQELLPQALEMHLERLLGGKLPFHGRTDSNNVLEFTELGLCT